MIKKLLAPLAVLLTLGLPTVAHATLLKFSYNIPALSFLYPGLAYSGSGTLTATYDSTRNSYLVTGITGTTSAFGRITGLLAPGTFKGNDNLLFYPDGRYPDDRYLDYRGISFSVAGTGDNGRGEVNIYHNRFFFGYGEKTERALPFGSFTVTPVNKAIPEPSGLGLLAIGVFVIVIFYRRSLRNQPRSCY